MNGVLALHYGAPTNKKSGRPLLRSAHMPSRPASADLRSIKISSVGGAHTIAIDLTQGAGVREAKGGLTVDGVLYRPGFLQTTPGWASISGSGDRAISVIVDQRPPSTVIVKIEGQDEWSAVPVTATIRGQ